MLFFCYTILFILFVGFTLASAIGIRTDSRLRNAGSANP